jgi:hypothetical protein
MFKRVYKLIHFNLSTYITPGNPKWGSITVPLTSCLTGLEFAVCQLTIFVFICKTDLPALPANIWT